MGRVKTKSGASDSKAAGAPSGKEGCGDSGQAGRGLGGKGGAWQDLKAPRLRVGVRA